MNRFYRSKFFIILTIITLAAVIFPTVFSVMGVGGVFKNVANAVVLPFQKLFGGISDSLDGFVSYFTEFDRLVEENRELKEQISEMKDKVSAAEETEIMNEWLFNYLELKREHTDYVFCDADITGRESGNYMTVFTLDRGTAHGVAANMPVVTSEGIVGYVTEGGRNWCKAVTIIESGTAIGAYVERSGEFGVIEGAYELKENGLCALKYTAQDADIQVGDRIISSGYGSVYPRGLIIGTVESITPNDASRTMEIYVRPCADITDLQKVMIITSYENYVE